VDLRFVAGGEPLGDAIGQMHAVTPWTRIVVGPGRPGAFDTSSPRLGGSEWLRLLFEDAQPVDNADLLPDHRAQLLDDVGPHVIEP
jgi:hypothetical protein